MSVNEVRDLEKVERQMEYEEKLRNRWRVFGMEDAVDVEEDWRKSKAGLVEGAEMVCGVVNVDRKCKGSLWDKSLRVPIKINKWPCRMKQGGSERNRRVHKQ